MSAVHETSPALTELDTGEVFEPRYDMTAEEARALCSEFLGGKGIDASQGKFSCHIISTKDRFSNLGRFVESTVFKETFDNTPELMDEEYRPYDDSSEFYVVTDNEEQIPVGVMRIIRNSEAGLKTVNDINKLDLGFTGQDVQEGYGLDMDRCVDIATLAVLEDYRGPKAMFIPSLLTYKTLYNEILTNPAYDSVVTIIDKKAEKNMYALKFPFAPIFDSPHFSYLDSAESRLLIGVNQDFQPQLTYWADQLQEEATAEQDDMKALKAASLSAIVRPGFLDPMLAGK